MSKASTRLLKAGRVIERKQILEWLKIVEQGYVDSPQKTTLGVIIESIEAGAHLQRTDPRGFTEWEHEPDEFDLDAEAGVQSRSTPFRRSGDGVGL